MTPCSSSLVRLSSNSGSSLTSFSRWTSSPLPTRCPRAPPSRHASPPRSCDASHDARARARARGHGRDREASRCGCAAL
eukprot:753661-Hanusia_phi.AAC.4